MIPNVLSIAGTDPTGGAGIHADLKTFSALGAYAMAAITAVVAQNTQGVRAYVALDADFVGAQIDAVFDDVSVHAVKIGMVANARIAEVIARRLLQYQPPNVVLDPVMVAKSGDHLLEPDAVSAVRDLLVPLATVITPNLPEAGVLLGLELLWSLPEMRKRVVDLRKLDSEWVLLKGGHLEGSAESVDILHGALRTIEFVTPRIRTSNDHGTGCTLSAAVAALLPTHSMEDSIREAKTYLQGALAASEELVVGCGHGPLHHFYKLWGDKHSSSYTENLCGSVESAIYLDYHSIALRNRQLDFNGKDLNGICQLKNFMKHYLFDIIFPFTTGKSRQNSGKDAESSHWRTPQSGAEADPRRCVRDRHPIARLGALRPQRSR